MERALLDLLSASLGLYQAQADRDFARREAASLKAFREQIERSRRPLTQERIDALHAHTENVATVSAIVRQNLEATCADANDVAQAVERRDAAHREWSQFTGEEGRA